MRKCETAEEFLDYLSPRGKNDVWQGREYYEWAFRGHAIDDKYKLLPLALRSEKNPFENLQAGPIVTEREQIAAERDVLLKFCNYIDKMGMAIPEDSQNFRRLLAHIQTEDFLTALATGAAEWIPGELHAAAALAQHYALPTRLLDWSWSHLAAAYFAAEEAARLFALGEIGQSTNLSVWAFNPEKLRRNCADAKRTPVIVVHTPRATNPNLHAQHGLFTMPVPRFGPTGLSQPVERISLNELLLEVHESFLLHVMLPASQAGRLLYQVSQEGIDGAALFPGYAGMVRAMKEASLWDRS